MHRTTLAGSPDTFEDRRPRNWAAGRQTEYKMSSVYDNHMHGQANESHANGNYLLANRLLSALPKSEFKRLEPHFSSTVFEEGQILLEPGQPMQRIYFPMSGLVSLSLDGGVDGISRGATNVGIVGRDGMIGTVSALGTNPTFSRAKVEIEGDGVAIPAEVLHEEFARGGELQNLMMRHLQIQIAQASQTALCIRTHSLEQRLSYWLLLIHDEVPLQTIQLSLSFYSHLLRTSYTDTILTAAVLWQHGLIRFCHEYVTIVNRQGLEESACSCYAIIRHELQQLGGTIH